MDNRRAFVNPTMQLSSYTWHDQWLSDFESPWSIFEKFRYVNEITNKELINTFGINQIRNFRGKIAEKYTDLITLRGFDAQRLNYAFNLNIIQFHKKQLKILFGIEDNYLDFYIEDKLKYCDFCINSGFHSLLNQFNKMIYCPYHGTLLKHSCPYCGKGLQFRVDVNSHRRPFHCECGKPLFNKDTHFLVRWRKYELNTIINESVKKWLNKREMTLNQYLFFEAQKKAFELLLDFSQ